MLELFRSVFSEDASLWSLFFASLITATFLSLPSEVMVLAAIKAYPADTWLLVAVASVGNTLGSVLTYWMARLVPHRKPIKYEDLIRRYGAPAMLLAWLPLVGDATVAVAGWLRLAFVPCLIYLAIGKFARYAFIALVA